MILVNQRAGFACSTALTAHALICKNNMVLD
jgi:hypothetical protein